MQPEESRVVLHIGMHKTGTSTIQNYLFRHEDELLRQHGVYYADAGRTEPARKRVSHHILAWQSVERYATKFGVQQSDALWHALRREVEEVRPRVVVLSSEFFWAATEAEIVRMRQNLGSLPASVVLYVRNPLGLAVSAYKQGVKTGTRWIDFESFLRERLSMFDFGTIADRWSNAFGRDALLIRIYDKVKTRLTQDFAEACGFEASDVRKAGSKNVSPSDGVIHLIRGLNLVERRAFGGRNRLIHRLRRNILRRRMPGAIAYRMADTLVRTPLIQEAHVAYLRREVGHLQERFLAEYVPAEDHAYLRF